MDIQPYLRLLVEKSASDLFFTADSAVKLKLEGRVTSVGKTMLTPDLVKAAANSIMDDRLRQVFSDTLECDFAIALPDESARFRTSACRNSAERAYHIPCSTLAQVCMSPTGSTLIKTISANPMLIDQKEKDRSRVRHT